MKNNEIYSKEELDFFNNIENGNYNSLKESEVKNEKIKASKIAKETIKTRTRKKSISLRLFENDIQNIKSIALEKGLPYQTLITYIVHKVATKQIKI